MSGNEFIEKEELAEIEELETKKKKKEKVKKKRQGNRILVQLMNGEFLSKDNFIGNLPFLFYIGFLMVVLIGWGYYGETVTKQEVQLKKELGELNSEYFTLGSEYNTRRGRRQTADRLVGTGVHESTISPRKIRIPKYVFHKDE
ncbi:MAG: hypothetical protein MK078_05315 [Crocinitomicaceae bacterium]|nr:hypothetical protein [Crocinitomicaceae bacterium]